MPTYEVTGPDGQKYRVTAPEGATKEQVMNYVMEQTKPGVGRSAVRGSNQFVADVFGLPVDTTANLINLGIAGYGAATGKTPPLIENPVGGSQSIAGAMEFAGIGTTPLADKGMAKFAYNYGRAGGLVPLFAPASAAVAAAQQVTDNPAAQLVGIMVPGAAGRAAQGAVRGLLRGGEEGRKTLETNIRTLESVGVEPTVGAATQRNFPMGVEGAAGKLPGGRGPMAKRADQISEATKGFTQNLAQKLSPLRDETRAGRGIQGDIDPWVEKFQQKWSGLNTEFLKHFQQGEQISAPATNAYLQRQTAQSPAAKKVLKGVESQKMQGLQKDWQDVIGQDGTLAIEDLREIRSFVGQKLASANLVDDISIAQWRGLYGALTKDIEAAAKAKGPVAAKDFKRTNDFYRSGMERIDSVLKPLARAGTPEKAYKAALEGSDTGATKLWAIRRSVSPQQWNVLQATIIDRLARVTKGRQDASGELASIETFLTNYNGLHPRAKSALFGVDTDVRKQLDTLAKAGELVKRSGTYLANPSGTAAAALSSGGLATGLGSLSWFIGGNFGVGTAIAGAAAGAAVGSYGTARLFSSPKFVKWLTQSRTVKPSEMATHVSRLAVLANREKDPEMAQALTQAYISESERLQQAFGTSDPKEFDRAYKLAQIPQ